MNPEQQKLHDEVVQSADNFGLEVQKNEMVGEKFKVTFTGNITDEDTKALAVKFPKVVFSLEGEDTIVTEK